MTVETTAVTANQEYKTIDFSQIKTSFENYGERNEKDSKTAEELKTLKNSIVANGIKEPLQVDKNFDLIGGNTRLKIIKKIVDEQGLTFYMVPVIVNLTVDLSGMSLSGVQLLQNRLNTRVKIPFQKTIKLMKSCYADGMEISEIADNTGYEEKEVRVNIGIIEDKNTIRMLDGKSVSKNSIKEYCKHVKNNKNLIDDTKFVSLFISAEKNEEVFNGKALEFEVKKYLMSIKKDDVSKIAKSRFSFKPVINQTALNDLQTSVLKDCDTVMSNLTRVSDEELKGILAGLIVNIQSIYGMDELSRQSQKDEHDLLVNDAKEKVKNIDKSLVNIDKKETKAKVQAKAINDANL